MQTQSHPLWQANFKQLTSVVTCTHCSEHDNNYYKPQKRKKKLELSWYCTLIIPSTPLYFFLFVTFLSNLSLFLCSFFSASSCFFFAFCSSIHIWSWLVSIRAPAVLLCAVHVLCLAGIFRNSANLVGWDSEKAAKQVTLIWLVHVSIKFFCPVHQTVIHYAPKLVLYKHLL